MGCQGFSLLLREGESGTTKGALPHSISSSVSIHHVFHHGDDEEDDNRNARGGRTIINDDGKADDHEDCNCVVAARFVETRTKSQGRRHAIVVVDEYGVDVGRTRQDYQSAAVRFAVFGVVLL